MPAESDIIVASKPIVKGVAQMSEEDPEREAPETADSTRGRRFQRWMVATAIILSLATLLSAWCGYEASRWNSQFTKASRAATVARIDSVTASNLANRQLTTDIALFSDWFKAEVEGNNRVADEVRLHFRSEFMPVFEGWLASSQPGRLAAGTPFDSTYVLAANVEADRLTDLAKAATLAADDASGNSDNYVLAALLFASVLFLAGISSKIPGDYAQRLTIVLSGVAFVVAVGFTFSLPMTL